MIPSSIPSFNRGNLGLYDVLRSELLDYVLGYVPEQIMDTKWV